LKTPGEGKTVSQVVRDFYNASPSHEWERLARPYRRLEFVSTMYLIEKYFPPSGHVVDVGCGPGRYSVELMRRGYRVTLVDVTEGLLDIAKEQIAAEGLKAEAVVRADACCLDFLPGESIDAALLMGPLYHLVKPEDRKQALFETRRILRTGGVAIVAYLNSWGILRSLLTEVPAYYKDLDVIYNLTREYTQVGYQKGGFTEAYFTVPPAAKADLESAGFEVVSYAGVESFCSGSLDPVKAIHDSDPEAYRNILKVAAELCEAPQYRDSTEHLHFVLRKPG
jgi:ubiquinone/menaquinone biosynthesis C-methylase UbiE